MKHLLGIITVAVLSLSAFGQSLLNASRGIPQPNDGTTGTVLWSTAIVNAAGNAATAQIGNTTVPVRIVIGGAGTSGNATLASNGTLAPCTMDAPVTSGGNFFVVESTSTAGQCHPQSGPPNAGTWVIGYLHDPTTTAGSTALVHVNGFIFGNSASLTGVPNPILATAGTTLPAPVAGQGAIGIATGGVPQISVNGGAWTAIPTTGGGGSGTVSANTGNLAYIASYTATTGSTTVNPATIAVSNGTGIAMGPNVLQFGPGGFATSDASINRLSANVLAVGNSAAQGNSSGWLRTNGSCTLNSDTAASGTATVCSRLLPAYSTNWAVHCAVPFIFATGSGIATVTGVLSYNQTPVGATTWSGQILGTNGPSFNTYSLAAVVSNAAVVALSVTSIDTTTIRTFYLDGSLYASATAGTFSVGVSTTSGTLLAKAGTSCTIQ